jgi:glycosyltransferase involved in cell wall biosynthesis
MATQTISIAMATYNGARWLPVQLDSFARQTRLPDELVITDDGSTDETAAVVAAFADTAPFPVRFVRNARRLGFNGNFAHAIALTTGDIVFISDQDDAWYPHKIERVADLMATTPGCLCVVNDQAIADAQGLETGGTVLGNVRAMGRPDGWFGPGCCTAFSRALMPVAMPMPGDVVQYDHWVNALAEAMGARRILDAPLQMYRRHGNNASGSVFTVERPGWRHLVRAARRTDGAAAMGAKVAEIDALLARLAMPAATALAVPGTLATTMAAMRAERADYAARRDALARGRVSRAGLILRLLAQGRYRRFSGATTAIKDMLS